MMRYHIFRHTHLILWGMGLIIPNSMVSASEFLMKIALFGGMIPIWIDQVAIRLDSRISATQTVVQQQTWRCELWANCTKMEVWIDPGVFLTHLWKPWISLIKVWASKLQHTGDVEKASIWQGRCIAQLLWIELLQIQRGNGTSPMYKWFTMIYLLTKMTIVHCYVKLPEAIMNDPDILMSLWWNWWNTPASWPPSWMFLRKVTQNCFFSSCSFWIL